jgi:integrin beta 3
MLERAVAALPPATPGKDGAPGAPGLPGKDGPSEEVVREIAAQAAHDAVVERMAGFPPIPQGAPGEPGPPGKDADIEAITADVMERVAEALKAIPVPKNGQDGQDGEDGVGLAGALIDRSGGLVVTLTDGSQRELGPVVGKDGEPGKDGADALGFDDLSIEFDGERTFKFVMVQGDRRKEFGPFAMPVIIDRGVFKEGNSYQRGDGTTWGGSFWIAQEDTSDKPETSKAWRLAVKRGRDGKDGVLKAAPEHKPVSIGK